MTEAFASRLAILRELAEKLEQRRAELLAAEAEDNIGTPASAAAMELDMAMEHLRTMEVEVPYVAGKSPYGTVAAILPYDALSVMVARVGGAAILGGNQFRFSCSSQTPRLASLFQEIVAPLPGFTAIAGLDNREFGRQCVEDPTVRVFFISGGGAVGAAYEKQVQHFDKLFFAGPSGLPPAILFKDAPIERAVEFLVRRAFINGGQYCTSLKRAYIHREIYDRVKALILEMMPEVKVGDPPGPGNPDRPPQGEAYSQAPGPGFGGFGRASLPGAAPPGRRLAGAVSGGNPGPPGPGTFRPLPDINQGGQRRGRGGTGVGQPLCFSGDLVRHPHPRGANGPDGKIRHDLRQPGFHLHSPAPALRRQRRERLDHRESKWAVAETGRSVYL